jgi:hypothetical protein
MSMDSFDPPYAAGILPHRRLFVLESSSESYKYDIPLLIELLTIIREEIERKVLHQDRTAFSRTAGKIQ